MLELRNITKQYVTGDERVDALGGVSIRFRKSEFVSILGPSGCGKTTMLNIIGGLDRYTSGDLIIGGRSTKSFRDGDWDTYRNHSIGFVFQSYNLIPHQSVLSNVELALTLSGVSKAERRRRATEALERVGLGNQLKKRPNQLSGGQMQRVAIARALVNDPEILLADEPTGALDSVTSVQIMDLLREISKTKLVIMVTHNNELAKEYSTRIISLRDGLVTGDTDEYDGEGEEASGAPENDKKTVKRREKRASMSFFTALSLSFNNLRSKFTRTLLVSFAGSIGIIGIALILSCSNGVQLFIDRVQEDTLSSYPITIQRENVDMTSLITSMMGITTDENGGHDRDAVYSSDVMLKTLEALNNPKMQTNDLREFKKYIEANPEKFDGIASAIKYTYALNLQVYSYDQSGRILKINPSDMFDGMGDAAESFKQMPVWQEMLPGRDGSLVNELVMEQYDVIYGEWPQNENEIVFIVDKNNDISDIMLYSLGLKDRSELEKMIVDFATGSLGEGDDEAVAKWAYDEIVGMEYKLVLPTAFYKLDRESGNYYDVREDENADIYLAEAVNSGITLRVSGIIRPNPEATAHSLMGAVGYTSALTDKYIALTNASEPVVAQLGDSEVDIFKGVKFTANLNKSEQAERVSEYVSSLDLAGGALFYRDVMIGESLDGAVEGEMARFSDRESMIAYINMMLSQSGYSEDKINEYMESMQGYSEQQLKLFLRTYIEEAVKEAMNARFDMMGDEMLAGALIEYVSTLDVDGLAGLIDYLPKTSTYEENLSLLGYVDAEEPFSVSLYAVDFDKKDAIADIIDEYNGGVADEQKISYTDYVAILMSNISIILNIISIVLIGFVSISLVVSSIMIGIITYISVLERTKEIGILRAVGASKRNVSSVFNAETFILGLASGTLGIAITLGFVGIINLIIPMFTDISVYAELPLWGAVGLIIVSVILNLIAGILPSRIAAKKDPVIALRTE